MKGPLPSVGRYGSGDIPSPPAKLSGNAVFTVKEVLMGRAKTGSSSSDAASDNHDLLLVPLLESISN